MALTPISNDSRLSTVDKMEAIHHYIRRTGYNTLSEAGKEMLGELTIQQAFALAAVRRLTRTEPEGILHGTLAHEMRLTPSAITRLVEPLVNAGLLERNPSAHDRRRVLLTLTSAGIESSEMIEKGMLNAIDQITSTVTDEERAIHARIVDKIYSEMVKLEPPGTSGDLI